MTLYFHDYSDRPNQTVIEIPAPSYGHLKFGKFGAMFVTNDPITDGFEESSILVGRGQGMLMAIDGSNTHVLISIVFTNNEYKGNTLEIQGTSFFFQPVKEVVVVDGTGKFRLARGYATFETVYYDPTRYYVVIRCNVIALHY